MSQANDTLRAGGLTSPSLLPQERPMTPSFQDFRARSTNTSAVALRQELDALEASAPAHLANQFKKEMADFYRLFLRFFRRKEQRCQIELAPSSLSCSRQDNCL
ncbi:hypothetical protein DSO57_1025980 [Entomophthora muscae]|uniref:Uncharacterized protein n=1 Tax=Entomophthora muscae TaxID=34485 RepID=A0ACC2UC09_9FUNG|nr:hypothetical protein DSO57_1025980 [Entomophthora muscae]